MKKVKNKTLSMISTIITAGMGVVPAHSFSINNSLVTANESFIYESIPDELVSFPLEHATQRMREKTECMQTHLKNIKEEWKQNNYAPIKPNKNSIGSQYREYIELHVNNMLKVLNAVKTILKQEIDLVEKERKQLIEYGRSISLYISACQNIVSFIEQTHKPQKTTEAKLNVTDGDVKKLIRSEHKKLGLGKPNFDIAGANG